MTVCQKFTTALGVHCGLRFNREQKRLEAQRARSLYNIEERAILEVLQDRYGLNIYAVMEDKETQELLEKHDSNEEFKLRLNEKTKEIVKSVGEDFMITDFS